MSDRRQPAAGTRLPEKEKIPDGDPNVIIDTVLNRMDGREVGVYSDNTLYDTSYRGRVRITGNGVKEVGGTPALPPPPARTRSRHDA